MKKLEELKNIIEGIEVSYDYEETYNNLYNAITDYENDTQDFDFGHVFDDIISYDVAEEKAKYELEEGGLVRLYYFMGDANMNNNLFRLNGYGNLEDITKDDLDTLKEEILDRINEKIEDESENNE